jgi:hypothetical protein
MHIQRAEHLAGRSVNKQTVAKRAAQPRWRQDVARALTVPICDVCWLVENPGWEPVRLKEPDH